MVLNVFVCKYSNDGDIQPGGKPWLATTTTRTSYEAELVGDD